jgi:hypothetical protein
VALCAASTVILLAAPVQAAGPLALLAHQIVKQVIKDFVQSQLTSLVRESLGPCKSMLADMGVGALGTVQGLASGIRGGSLPGMPGTQAMQGMDPAMQARMMQMMPNMMDAQAMQMMAGMPGMQGAAPLSGDEVDELVTRLVALSKAMPDQALPCSPEELKLVFNMSASMPMVSAPFRTMLSSFRTMDEGFKEVRETFAKMSSEEQAEAIDLMLADAPSMSAEERKQFAGFLQSDLFGLPPAARAQVRARLGGVR